MMLSTAILVTTAAQANVNTPKSLGPALWFGIMLLLLPMVFAGMNYQGGKYLGRFMSAYMVIGVVLLVLIVAALP